MKHQTQFLWFDLIRGLSALLVCAGHLRAAIIVDYGDVHALNGLHTVFYLLTGLGHQAVMIFFVLSGFFVGGSVLRKAASFSLSQYAAARLTRLWIVLVPALVFTAGMDRLINGLDPRVLAGAYSPVWNSGPADAGSFSDSFVTFIGNCTFLQTIVVPVFGVNGPLWSLANEFWYYVLFPCFACAFMAPARAFPPRTRWLFGLAGLGLLVCIPGGMRAGFLIWLLGVLVWMCRALAVRGFHRHVCVASGFLLFLTALAYSKSPGLQMRLGLSGDLAVGLGFVALAASLAWTPVFSNAPGALVTFARVLANFSYSLYVVHFPLVILIAVGFYRARKIQPDATGLLQWNAWFCVLIVSGFAFWWCFEKRTEALRRLIAPGA